MFRMKSFIILMVFLCLMGVQVLNAQKASQDAARNEEVKELPVTVILSSTLDERPVAVSSAWLGYALSRLAWINDNVEQDDLKAYTYTGSFYEEFTGRESLAAIWDELKAADPLLKDQYLDELLLVKSNGFLREYVWVYFGNDSWQMPQEELKFEEFAEWHEVNLSGHDPETLAGLEIR